VAQPRRREAKRARRSPKGEDGLVDDWLADRQNFVRENITSHALSFGARACGISDIVKRRSIRVWDLAKQFAFFQSLSPDHFGARPSQDERVVNDPVSEA